MCPQTVFYAESGGQLGDTGTISSGSTTLKVLDTQKACSDTFTHIVRVVEGEVRVGDQVALQVDERRRKDLCIHHSATHLLHLALREVLGEHVKASGFSSC